MIKEGQAIGFLDQFGNELPIRVSFVYLSQSHFIAVEFPRVWIISDMQGW